MNIHLFKKLLHQIIKFTISNCFNQFFILFIFISIHILLINYYMPYLTLSLLNHIIIKILYLFYQ